MAKERVERDEEDLVRLYLTDIGQYPLLTKDDEVRLAQAIEKGAEARVSLESADELTAAKRREFNSCLLYTSPSPRDRQKSRMPSSA